MTLHRVPGRRSGYADREDPGDGGGERTRASCEPIEPTYPAPLGSVAEARRVIAAAMDRFADVALAWEPPGAD